MKQHIMMTNDPTLLVHNASQLLTLAGGPQRGRQLGSLGVINDGAVLIKNGKIAAVGKSKDLLVKYPNALSIDAQGTVAFSFFIDDEEH